MIDFAEPQWVHLIWPVIGWIALLTWLDRAATHAVDRFISPTLHSRLVARPSAKQRGSAIFALALFGALSTFALMRPQWGAQIIALPRVGAEIMICLDVSRSMLAEDVAPNRLERAKADIRDLLPYLSGDQVGLIAFAGRASVLSPLTPDFGFLRLVLDSSGPHSVTRGGTRLEEPLRKAIAGFRSTSDASRSIILITDGEDHDSFPLEAAKAAAERGIRILAIGFGKEAGSEIWTTDPRTGARTQVRDAAGQPVISRLDGEALREIVLLTEGAYVPAGTAVLDLRSIYDAHIAPLTRGKLDLRAKTIRHDAYQWVVALTALCLLAAVALATRRVRTTQTRRNVRAPGALAILLVAGFALTGFSAPTSAQTVDQTPVPKSTNVNREKGDSSTRGLSSLGASSEPAKDAVEAENRTARELYNQGLDRLQINQLEQAERLLTKAREGSGSDGETRFRATYNLGWLEARVADGLMESDAKAALTHVERSAAWFRAALDLRPEHEDTRANLEMMLKRAIQLADSLRTEQDDKLIERIEKDMGALRELLAKIRDALRSERGDEQLRISDQLRQRFRSLSGEALTVLADMEVTNRQAAKEQAGLNTKAADKREPKESLRLAQLEGVLAYLHRARGRLGQARTGLRRGQGVRAFRRASDTLGALNRARDQLLEPVARLDALLADSHEVGALTERRSPAGLSTVAPPLWLTSKHLADRQINLNHRVTELENLFGAALTNAKAASAKATDRKSVV